jgi:hypothetical protein
MTQKKDNPKVQTPDEAKASLTQKLVDLVSPGVVGSDRRITKTPES